MGSVEKPEGEEAMTGTAVMPDVQQRTSIAPRVLVVDDDAPLRRMLSLTLRDAGFVVMPAPNGQAALELLASKSNLPDAIVLDLEMPVMDGRSFYRELRDRNIAVPVLLVSAYGARTAQHQLGADASLDKPFNPDELIRRVQSLVQRAA